MHAKPIDADELERSFQERAQDDLFSGIALITQGSVSLFTGAFGDASRSWKIASTLTTRFETASVTKLFTAVATMQLIERGLLAFETPAVATLGLRETAVAPTVTVHHLLTASGCSPPQAVGLQPRR